MTTSVHVLMDLKRGAQSTTRNLIMLFSHAAESDFPIVLSYELDSFNRHSTYLDLG